MDDKNIKAGAAIHSGDGGYGIGTRENYEEFVKTRNKSLNLKQEEQQGEPVAITITGKLGNIYSFTGDYSLKKGDKVYTTPQQRKPLSIEQIHKHWQVAKVLDMTDAEIDFADYVLITRDVEALHGITE